MPDFSEFRGLLREATKQALGGQPVGLLLSGGTDSLTVLWSLLDLGADVRCYTFRLERVVSGDSRAAALAAKTWGVPLREVVIPYVAEDALQEEVTRLVRAIGTGRKTAVECTWPFLHVVPEVRESCVFCGLNADDLWGSARSVAVRYSADPAGFTSQRRQVMADPRSSAWAYIGGLFTQAGKRLFSPYRSVAVIDYLLRFSWTDLNRPKQKMPAVRAFADRYSEAAIYRRNDNLQCGSGVREYLARLLVCPETNPWGARTQAALYRRYLGGGAGAR